VEAFQVTLNPFPAEFKALGLASAFLLLSTIVIALFLNELIVPAPVVPVTDALDTFHFANCASG
jgi:hypothetical protein